MKRIIFTIFDDIKKELSGPTELEAKQVFNMDQAASLLVEEYFDKLVENKKDYSKKIGVDFKFFHNEMKNFFDLNETDFTLVNLYKHHLFSELSKEYDEVMYVDMDVVFNTDLNVFEELDLSQGIHIRDQDADIQCKEKEEIILTRVGKRNPTLKYFITKDLLDGQDNHVMNTGIMIGKSEHIQQIKFVERIKEASDRIQHLKEEPFLINKHYYANNESIFSYILEKYNIPYVLLDEMWHKIYDDKPVEGLEGYCIHFINKQFGRFFKDKTKAIFSLHIDIPDNNLDNPKGCKDLDVSKSKFTQIQLDKYKEDLINNHKEYANAIGAEYLHFNRDNEYEEFFKRFPDLTEYDIVNLYKIWLLDKLVKEYDLVMYIDLDVYFRNNASIFDTVPANYAVCAEYITKESALVFSSPTYFKFFDKCFRDPQSKYWNTHALLTYDGIPGENYIYNTGVLVASKYGMEKLDYFSDIDEVIEMMKELKEDEFSMYPQNVVKAFGYDNETIFSYKINKNNVPLYHLTHWWHFKHHYSVKTALIKDHPKMKTVQRHLESDCEIKNVTIVHFISKNFGLVFDK